MMASARSSAPSSGRSCDLIACTVIASTPLFILELPRRRPKFGRRGSVTRRPVMLVMLTAGLALHVPPRAGRVCAQLDPSRIELGRGGLFTPPPTPVPSIAVLADKQQLATLLASNWAEAAGSTGGFSGDAVEVGPSAVHGLGLIARRNLEEGTVVTLYPVHRVLQSLGDGRGAACLADEEGDDYFRPSKPISDEENAYRQTAYRQTYNHPDPNRPESFMLDADPTKPDLAGWLGHRVNDGAILVPGSSSDAEVPRPLVETLTLALTLALTLLLALTLILP